MKVTSTFLVASALQAGLVVSQGNSSGVPSELPYYGLSPPVYPSREFVVILLMR